MLKKNIRFEWTDACRKLFQKLRDKLSTYPVLEPSDWDQLFHVFCNAGNVAVGNALCQSTEKKGKDQPITYASKQLTPAKKNCSTTERKYLAIVISIKKFKHYLMCNPVVFFMDHMAIKYLVNKTELSVRLARWRNLIIRWSTNPVVCIYKTTTCIGCKKAWTLVQYLIG